MNIKEFIKNIPIVQHAIEQKKYNRKLDLRSLSVEERVERVMKRYETRMGYRMDMNHPKTYTEKIQWYKIFYTGDGHLDRIVDKYLMKEYVKEKIGDGYTVPLIGVWSDTFAEC